MTTLIPKFDLKNGGSIPTGAINRSIYQKLSDIISVKDFGAVGDGSTDDTAAIQAAVTAATGIALYFPSSTYATTTAITLPSNITIFGDGPTKSVIKRIGAGTDNLFVGTDISNINFRQIGFYGNSQATNSDNGDAIFYTQTISSVVSNKGIYIDYCNFDNFKGDNWVYIGNANTTYALTDIRITNCKFTSYTGNCRNGSSIGVASNCITMTGTNAASGAKIYDIWVENNVANNYFIKMFFAMYYGCERAHVVSNTVLSNGLDSAIANDTGAYAFLAYGGLAVCNNVSYIDNIVEGVKSCGFYNAGTTNLRIIGNRVYSQTDTVTTNLPKGAFICNSTQNVIIANNQAESIAVYGVYFIPPSNPSDGDMNIQISNNNLKTCGTGVYLFQGNGESRNITVDNNNITNFTSFGIRLASFGTYTMQEVYIHDNLIITTTASTYGIIYASLDSNYVIYTIDISNNTIATPTTGIQYNNISAGYISIDNNKFIGNFSSYAIDIANNTKMIVTNNWFINQSTGYCFNSTGSQGSLKNNIFENCATNRIVVSTGSNDFGLDAPNWTPTGIGPFMQNLVAVEAGSASSKYVNNGWYYSGTAWLEQRTLTGN
jgi:polygalacturonase